MEKGNASTKQSRKVKRVKERLREMVTNQTHPFDRFNFLRILTFSYLSPVYDYLGAGLEFKAEDGFRAPKSMSCQLG